MRHSPVFQGADRRVRRHRGLRLGNGDVRQSARTLQIVHRGRRFIEEARAIRRCPVRTRDGCIDLTDMHRHFHGFQDGDDSREQRRDHHRGHRHPVRGLPRGRAWRHAEVPRAGEVQPQGSERPPHDHRRRPILRSTRHVLRIRIEDGGGHRETVLPGVHPRHRSDSIPRSDDLRSSRRQTDTGIGRYAPE